MILNAYLMAPMYAIRRQFMAVVGFDTSARLAEIQSPTLVLAGTADRIIPIENSRRLADGIPAAELVEFEGAGHGFVVERAEATNIAVLGFLAGQRGAAAA
jgi:pimeloyl-ACP methyl ester carboxylesterase